MVSLTTVILLTIVALAIGLAIGAFSFQRFGQQGRQTQDLEQRLQKAEQQFQDYQDNVTEHFEETSRRVNTLTQNYKDVHEYLASSAMKLTTPQMSAAISQAAHKNLPGTDPNEREVIESEADFEDKEMGAEYSVLGEEALNKAESLSEENV